MATFDLDWWGIDELQLPHDAALLDDQELRVELDAILAESCTTPPDDATIRRICELVVEWSGRQHGGKCPPWPADHRLPYDRHILRRERKGTSA